MYSIVNKRKLNDHMTWLQIKAPLIAKAACPGQFVIILTDEFGEKMPFSLAGYDKENGTIDIIYEVVGRGTMILDQFEEGDLLLSVAGPLGNPVDIEGLSRVCVVCGGLGTSSAMGLVSGLKNSGIRVDTVAGFKSDEYIVFANEIGKLSDNMFIVTDDGSYGGSMSAADKFAQLVNMGEKYDAVITVGPVEMMKKICEMADEKGMTSIASLCAYMIDGTGICGGCRVNIDGKRKYVCVDGPLFDGKLVDWESLIIRNTSFRETEEEDIKHVCRLTGGVRHND